MSDVDHEQRRDELAAYLLGALEPGEAAALERHLAGCEECRDELERLRPAVQVLPESVERREAPRQLRERVMAEVRAEAAPPQAARRQRRRRGGFWAAIPLRPAAGFAAVLLVGVAIAGYAIRGGGSDGEATTVVAGQAPGVTAKMVRNGDSGTLHLAHVRELRPSQVLQAWVRRGGRVEAAGRSFAPNPDGTAIVAIDDMRGVDTVMVTAEPRGGSSQPTSPPLVSVPVPQ